MTLPGAETDPPGQLRQCYTGKAPAVKRGIHSGKSKTGNKRRAFKAFKYAR